MKRFEEKFRQNIRKIDFDTLEESKDVIYGLSDSLDFIYFNEAWFEFSKLNNGEPDISNRFGLGTSLLNSISGVLKKYYSEKFSEILSNKTPWKHEYECSSVDTYRLFSMDVYPLENIAGLLVINSLKVQVEMTEEFRNKSWETIGFYRDDDGMINQCSNCRRTQRPKEPKIWDWVPTLVQNMPGNVSHTICPICFDYYWKNA